MGKILSVNIKTQKKTFCLIDNQNIYSDYDYPIQYIWSRWMAVHNYMFLFHYTLTPTQNRIELIQFLLEEKMATILEQIKHQQISNSLKMKSSTKISKRENIN